LGAVSGTTSLTYGNHFSRALDDDGIARVQFEAL